MKQICLLSGMLVLALGGPNSANGATIFYDDFEGGASLEWQDVSGAWTTASGLYGAPQTPNGAHALIPHSLGVSQLWETEIANVYDEGLWVDGVQTATNPLGVKGLLLVAQGFSEKLYWHVVGDGGNPWGPELGGVQGLYHQGENIRVGVERDALCNFTAFLNNVAVSTITVANCGGGAVGVYTNSDLQIGSGLESASLTETPEPSTVFLAAGGLACLVVRFRRERSRCR